MCMWEWLRRCCMVRIEERRSAEMRMWLLLQIDWARSVRPQNQAKVWQRLWLWPQQILISKSHFYSCDLFFRVLNEKYTKYRTKCTFAHESLAGSFLDENENTRKRNQGRSQYRRFLRFLQICWLLLPRRRHQRQMVLAFRWSTQKMPVRILVPTQNPTRPWIRQIAFVDNLASKGSIHVQPEIN